VTDKRLPGDGAPYDERYRIVVRKLTECRYSFSNNRRSIRTNCDCVQAIVAGFASMRTQRSGRFRPARAWPTRTTAAPLGLRELRARVYVV